MATDKGKNIRKKIGTVVSANQAKTLVVAVDSIKTHPLYRKKYQVTKRYQVHYDEGEFAKGDEVEIEEIRPISKTKRFRVVGKAAGNKEATTVVKEQK